MKLHEAIEVLKQCEPAEKYLYPYVIIGTNNTHEAIQCVIDHWDNSYTKMASKPDYNYQTKVPAPGRRRCHTCGCIPMKEL